MQQLNLFTESVPVLPITYYPDFLTQELANELYQHCLKLEWQQNQIRIAGKTMPVPRIECLYGDAGCDYLYSNSVFLKPLTWTEKLSYLRDSITALSGYKFRIVIGNQYRTGTDSIGWHSDNEPSMGLSPAIASVSLGSCRKFQIKPRNGKPTDFWLEHGSLLIMHLPFGQEKGVDDFIVAKGQPAFDALYNTAVALELWEIKLFTLLTYPPAIALNQRFLGQLLVPEGEKLIILKAPKGTGKTEWLATEVAKAHDQERRVLIITHRIQLGEALCNRFGVNYVTEVHTSETGTLLGYGVCVDSLHQESQARFNPNDWSNDVIIIDECDQVFWHLLNSGTEVQKRRVSVLKNLKQLVQNVLGSTQGKIYLSSADVSDTDVKYILSLAGEYRVNPFVIVNNYRHVAGNCYNYSGSNPKNLIAALDKAIAKGGHHLLCCSAQKAKSKWGTQALEERFRRKFPHLRILRIDSESVADPSHPAFGCIAHLNEILTQYDLVIASPSLETGVSIDIRGHFDAVWGIFQGVQPVNSVRQMLARVRETVDRHIWVREWGMSVVGNGSTSIGGLLRSQHVATQANIALLSAADNDDYSFVDQNFQPESLQTWGKRGSVINVEMRRYRESVLAGLVEDGYIIIDADDASDDESKAVIESVKAASEELYAAECEAIADSDELSQTELKKLQDKRAKTKTERHQQRKAELSRRYELDVTPDLVEKDDDGWYPQLRMHYYLTLGREFLNNRDAKRAKAQLEAGENSVWKPDFNKGQMLPSVLLLEELNLLQLLTPGERLRSSDEAMQEFKALALKHRYVIKNYLHVSISEKLTPIAIAQKLLAKIDLKLDYVGRLGKRENRECVYRFVPPDDQRDSIFGQWLNRDEVFQSESVSVSNNISTTTPVTDTTSLSISHNTEVVSGSNNNIVLATPLSDTVPHTPENIAILGWKGLKLKLQQGMDCAGSFYNQLVSTIGSAVGVADGEPYWNGYLGQWQVWVNFAHGCKSVVCDWLVAV